MICFVEQLSTYKIVYSNMDESELQKFFVIVFFFLVHIMYYRIRNIGSCKGLFFFVRTFLLRVFSVAP